jgi:hypothetical protein
MRKYPCNAFALIIYGLCIGGSHGDTISVTQKPQIVRFICSEMAEEVSFLILKYQI